VLYGTHHLTQNRRLNRTSNASW